MPQRFNGVNMKKNLSHFKEILLEFTYSKDKFSLNYYLTNIVLFLVYFIIISPLGILFRLIKRDVLRLKKNNQSSWISREDNQPIHFEKQY
jgi:hypothetical protein